MSVYTDAASDFGGEDPAGTVAATEKDVESGAQPVSAAKAPASSRGRAMLVPTDGGLVRARCAFSANCLTKRAATKAVNCSLDSPSGPCGRYM